MGTSSSPAASTQQTVPDYTLKELEDFEGRRDRGEQIPADAEAQIERNARLMRPFAEGIKAIAPVMRAIESLPPDARARYAHRTMRERRRDPLIRARMATGTRRRVTVMHRARGAGRPARRARHIARATSSSDPPDDHRTLIRPGRA